MKAKGSRIPNRRVFVFGAGVSASCGIAIARDILRQSILLLQTKEASKAKIVHDILRYLYPGFDESLRNYPNIEDFLNLVEMAKKFNSEEFIKSRVWSTSKLESVSEITLKAVTDYIWSQMNKKKEQEFVRAFVRENLKRGDTLITFNWDLTLERALEDLPGDPGFLYTYSRHRKNKEFSLLKPHGSVDWFETKRLRGLGYEKEVDKHDKQLCYYPEFNLGRTPKLKEIAPVIVPPVSAKEFKYDFLKRTWRWVYKAISSATEIHIIGYSLPKEDQFARLVFRRAIRNNILTGVRRTGDPPRIFVANPDGTVEQTFSSIVGRQIPLRFLQAYFEDIAEDYKTLIR